jgi:hypothetical protein
MVHTWPRKTQEKAWQKPSLRSKQVLRRIFNVTEAGGYLILFRERK